MVCGTARRASILVGKWLDEKAAPKFGVREVPRFKVAGWQVHAESITVAGDNAATYLARNALGGADEELFRALPTLRAPFSRYLRRAHCYLLCEQYTNAVVYGLILPFKSCSSVLELLYC